MSSNFRNWSGKRKRKIMEILANKQDGWYCSYCKKQLPEASGELYNGYSREDWKGFPSIDHYIPLIKGGTNNMSNFVLCCNHCNVKKGTKHGDEYLKELGCFDE